MAKEVKNIITRIPKLKKTKFYDEYMYFRSRRYTQSNKYIFYEKILKVIRNFQIKQRLFIKNYATEEKR